VHVSTIGRQSRLCHLLPKNGKRHSYQNYILLKTNALSYWHGLGLLLNTSDDERREEKESWGTRSAQFKIKQVFPKDNNRSGLWYKMAVSILRRFFYGSKCSCGTKAIKR
jgi:hypothetical protein